MDKLFYALLNRKGGDHVVKYSSDKLFVPSPMVVSSESKPTSAPPSDANFNSVSSTVNPPVVSSFIEEGISILRRW